MDELKERLFHCITGSPWKKIGVRPHHGITIPLFSIHSESSCGVGEFLDLIPMIDWCHALKLDVIQLLPLNDCHVESDPSPYNSISSCALEFIYLSLHALPLLDKLPELRARLSEYKKFNAFDNIAYADVFAYKKNWLTEYYAAVGEQVLENEEFQQYLASNPWLNYYALFKTLKISLQNIPWQTWPEDVRNPSAEKLKDLLHIHQKEVRFFLLLQFLCYTQLKAVKEYAKEKKVFLMGDIPFLVSVESADVWQNIEFFDLHVAGGAPPDPFNEQGQNWGMPIFHWDALRKNQFQWWKQRLQYAENFFDLFRLDHVIGFFRVWAIPPHHPAKEGRFIPEEEKEWEKQGKELLTMLASSTNMLPISEALGIVPEILHPYMDEMGICEIKLLRWERNWSGDKSYIPIQNYSPVSLTTVSTHDTETLALWWKHSKNGTKDYAEHKHWELGRDLSPEQREEILWDSHHTSSLFHVNLLQEYLALFPELRWQNPDKDRINIPGTVSPSNWTFRFRPSIEEITSHKELFQKMKKIIF